MNISLAPEVLFHIGSFTITNTLLVTWCILIGTCFFVWYISRRGFRLQPSGVQSGIEAIVEFWFSTIDSVTANRQRTLQFFPLVTCVFLFVLFSNLVELVPGLGTVGIYGLHEGDVALIPFIRSGSADLNFTLAMAVIVVMATWIYGIKELGIKSHFSKFFNFKNPIHTFIGLLELVSEFSRVISFSFRLFGNIFAGEVLLLVIAFLVPVIAGLPFLFLELFVGLVQALVFSMLTLVFLKVATDGHGEEEHAVPVTSNG